MKALLAVPTEEIAEKRASYDREKRQRLERGQARRPPRKTSG